MMPFSKVIFWMTLAVVAAQAAGVALVWATEPRKPAVKEYIAPVPFDPR
jgi:hypothetical protein